ncbi:hypothetical protein QF002_007441 [Paraburkholderia youngii]
MFGKNLVDSLFAVPESFLQFVVGGCHFLSEGRGFARLGDAIDWGLGRWLLRAKPFSSIAVAT